MSDFARVLEELAGWGRKRQNSRGGLSEAQNGYGYGFGMLPGYGLRDGLVSSSTYICSPAYKLSTALSLNLARHGGRAKWAVA